MIDYRIGTSRVVSANNQAVRRPVHIRLGHDGTIDVLALSYPGQGHATWIFGLLGEHSISSTVCSLALRTCNVRGFTKLLPEHVYEVSTLPASHHDTGSSDLSECSAASVQMFAANVPSTDSGRQAHMTPPNFATWSVYDRTLMNIERPRRQEASSYTR